MKSRSILLGVLSIVLMTTTSACSPAHAHDSNNSVTQPRNGDKQDGQIIAFDQLEVPNLDPGLTAYKMMYWSASTRTEAFVVVPNAAPSIAYPLFVSCHGGWAAPQLESHVSPYVSDVTSSADNLKQDMNLITGAASSDFITIIPMYRGYAASDGNVNGIDGNTVDVNNAIKAVISKYSTVRGHIYLSGVSMGGAVVLKLASERTDIRSTIAISPFVGWDIVGEWAYKNSKSETSQNWIQRMTSHYGDFNPNSATYQRVSIDYQKINAPVLLLQGTSDTYVPWQTVQMLYDDMKSSHKIVKFELFKGGDHGLYNVPQVREVINNWYREYGEKH